MKISEPVLFDSNILVYAHNQDALFHSQALGAVAKVIEGEIFGVLTSQNLLEFYSIMTDKKRLSDPVTSELASELVDQYLLSPFEIIYPNLSTNKVMIELLRNNEQSAKSQIKDGQIFDVYLVATMLSSNISHIITANTKDFERFDSISVLDFKTFSQH